VSERYKTLVEFVTNGLTPRKKTDHLIVFKNSLATCSSAYIEARMNATTQAEEDELKLTFANNVIDEYLGRVEDNLARASRRENKTRTDRARREAGVDLRWESLTANWMNPENLLPEKPAKRKVQPESIAA
jgi:hypothetical protein